MLPLLQDVDLAAGLNPGSLAVSSTAAAGQHWTIASRVPVTYPDGTTATLRVAAILGHPDITGDYLLDQAGWNLHAGQNLDSAVFIRVAAGSPASTVRTAVAAALHRRGADVAVLERDQQPNTAGAALTLWPNALRGLDQLGVGGQLRRRAALGGHSGSRCPDGRRLARTRLGPAIEAASVTRWPVCSLFVLVLACDGRVDVVADAR